MIEKICNKRRQTYALEILALFQEVYRIAQTIGRDYLLHPHAILRHYTKVVGLRSWLPEMPRELDQPMDALRVYITLQAFAISSDFGVEPEDVIGAILSRIQKELHEDLPGLISKPEIDWRLEQEWRLMLEDIEV